jgi:hypothetical protein
MVKHRAIPKLRPCRRAPRLLPPRIRIGARSIASMNETDLRRIQYLGLRIPLRRPCALYSSIEVGDGVSRVQANKVREVAVGIGWGVLVYFPF